MTDTASAVQVVELIGNPRPGSRTRKLADVVTEAVAQRITRPYDVTVLELGELVGVTFDAAPARGSGEFDDPFGVVRSARLLVVATPTYKATYSGLLKVFLDQFTQGDFSGAVAVPVAIAGVDEHRRSVEAALRDVLVELGASVPAPAVAVLEADIAERSLDDIAAEWARRYSSVLVDTLATGEQEPVGGHR